MPRLHVCQPILFGGSLLYFWYNGPQNPFLIIEAPILESCLLVSMRCSGFAKQVVKEFSQFNNTLLFTVANELAVFSVAACAAICFPTSELICLACSVCLSCRKFCQSSCPKPQNSNLQILNFRKDLQPLCFLEFLSQGKGLDPLTVKLP